MIFLQFLFFSYRKTLITITVKKVTKFFSFSVYTFLKIIKFNLYWLFHRFSIKIIQFAFVNIFVCVCFFLQVLFFRPKNFKKLQPTAVLLWLSIQNVRHLKFAVSLFHCHVRLCCEACLLG